MGVAELTRAKLTRADHGRRMSWHEFENCEFEEGLTFELARGVVEVSDIPDVDHALLCRVVRRSFDRHDDAHPGLIAAVLGNQDSKTASIEDDVTRHPDVTVYLTRPPHGGQAWAAWVPEIVVEVVSRSSHDRDYFEKPTDYWAVGVQEYLIADRFDRQLVVLTRGRHEWERRVLKPGDVYATPLLPGFALAVADLFPEAGP